jgi:phenylacetate-CoA ligase
MRRTIDKIYHTYYKKDKVYPLYSLFEQTQYWDYSRLMDYQLTLFKKIWKHCILNVPYYKKLNEDIQIDPDDIKSIPDLSSIPILTKDIVRSHFDEMIASDIPAYRFIKNSTSGTSGSNFYFYSDSNQHDVKMALEYRRYAWMNVKAFDRELIIWGASWDIKKKTNLKIIKDWLKNKKKVSGYNLSDREIIELYSILKSYKPMIIKSYPSILTTIVDVFQEKNLHYSPSAIHIGGEILFKIQREKIENFFGCPVYDFYGARDMPEIAQNCDQSHGLHVFMENVIVEVVNEDDMPIEQGEGDLVITNLHNYAMPFIRYKIGDRARISKNSKCTCGRNLQIIDEVIGRTFDIIRFPNGRRVGGTFWTLCMKSVPGIKNFQIIQETSNDICIYYTQEKNMPVKFERLRENIHEYSGPKLNIIFNKVDKIEPTNAGKMKFVIKN